MRRSLWLACAALLSVAVGCTTTLVQERVETPPDARLRVWAECFRNSEVYWADIQLENRSDEPLMVRPDSFDLRGDDERPMVWADWAWFGGRRHTIARQRPLQPGRSMFGRVKWLPRAFPPAVRLRVEIEGESHTFVFREP